MSVLAIAIIAIVLIAVIRFVVTRPQGKAIGITEREEAQRNSNKNQEERKRNAIEQLFSGSLPIVHFKIPSIICALYPWKSPSSKQELIGDLYFTDKGIVFIQLTDTRGFFVSEQKVEKRREEALTRVKIYSTDMVDLRQILEMAMDVLFIPRATINGIRYSWALGLQVNTSGEWQQFILEKGKKTYQQYRLQIDSYLAGLT